MLPPDVRRSEWGVSAGPCWGTWADPESGEAEDGAGSTEVSQADPTSLESGAPVLSWPGVHQMFTKSPNPSAKARGAISSGLLFQKVTVVGEGGREPPTPCL